MATGDHPKLHDSIVVLFHEKPNFLPQSPRNEFSPT